MTNRFMRALRRELKYRQTRPQLASLELTYRCNLRCQMCNLWSDYQDRGDSELPLAEWKQVIDDLAQLGTERVTLIGAEPLVRRDLLDIAGHIKVRGMSCLIITNGVLMTPDKANEIVKLGVDGVSFSIDAVGELHDHIRGVPGTFERAITGISNLLEARKQRGERHPELNVHVTISSINVRLLSGMIELAQGLGLDGCSFQYLVEISNEVVDSSVFDGKQVSSRRFSRVGEKSLLLTGEEIQILREQIRKITRSTGPQLSLQMLYNFPDTNLLEGKNPIKRCYQLHTKAVVDPFGNVVPCSFLENYRIGNVREQSLKQLWNSERYKRVRHAIRRQFLPICYHCCHFNYNITFLQALRAYLNLGVS